jgi:hypothetical protein
MAALVVVALFWGNCFSCPQMWLAATAHQAPHSCCHHKQTAKVECQSQALRHFVKAEPAGQAPALAVAVNTAPADVAAVVAPVPEVPLPADHAPPDLLSLHSSFRI